MRNIFVGLMWIVAVMIGHHKGDVTTQGMILSTAVLFMLTVIAYHLDKIAATKGEG